jgi:hypothetical protein
MELRTSLAFVLVKLDSGSGLFLSVLDSTSEEEVSEKVHLANKATIYQLFFGIDKPKIMADGGNETFSDMIPGEGVKFKVPKGHSANIGYSPWKL